MILQALYNYYQAMSRVGKIAPLGFEYLSIRWVVVITPEGDFVRLKDLKDPEDKKSKGQEYLVIKKGKRSSNILPFVLYDNSKYVFGCEYDPSGEYTLFPDHNLSFTKQIEQLAEAYPHNDAFAAILAFYRNYHDTLFELEGVNTIDKGDLISFQLQNDLELAACNEDAKDWGERCANADEAPRGVCLVTGESDLPIASLHPHIKLPGAMANATIVSFQEREGYDSYGKKQGYNAPISVKASFAHTTALNTLLANDKTKYRVGDISYLFWNSDALKDEINESYKLVTFAPSLKDEEDDSVDERESDSLFAKPKKRKKASPELETYKVLETFKTIMGTQGKATHWQDPRRFYVLGISGSGRIVIRYWKEGSVSELFGNTFQHLLDMNIVNWQGEGDEDNPPLRSLYGIARTVSRPGNKNSVDSNLIQSLTESVIDGTRYPAILQQACLNRILADRQVSTLRAAILKAYINRKIRTYKYNHITELKMALDTQNTHVAYVAGRIFAILEQIQNASLGSTNATIRDRFYGSASTRPSTVMGRLIALSNHHLAKLRKNKPGLYISFQKQLEELFALLPAGASVFPPIFNLDEQSLFAVGYYHQKAYRKGNDEDNDKNDNN